MGNHQEAADDVEPDIVVIEEEGGAGVDAPAAAPSVPVLDTFWQGRLIPGSRVESLPFIEAARKATAKWGTDAKEVLPDEAFARVR